MESPVAAPIAVCVIVTEAVSPAEIEAVVADTVKVSELVAIVADVGPVASKPRPNAVTTTSERRLKVNFVIYFLSKVVIETFSSTAGEENFAS
jgi:hypothetical protein